MMSIEVKKSKNVIFKELLLALLPDLTIWGSNNVEFMRNNYSDIINAAREFLATKDIQLTKSEFNLATREMCTKGRNYMISKSIPSNKQYEELSKIESEQETISENSEDE
ncbi:unnamed protein product [Brachionus calyciflorus]|uniref:Uncharacterized protein n=1 Tax=Brachionus calyciflorus TaxID=104777 RepID=A0A814AYI4_9BILA|nr:unnamed protein product [Brachionus calyciflorus]